MGSAGSQVISSSPKQEPFSVRSKHLQRVMDPRSPSAGITRTPIQVKEIASTEPQCLSKHTELCDDQVDRTDPRSPTRDISRTPLKSVLADKMTVLVRPLVDLFISEGSEPSTTDEIQEELATSHYDTMPLTEATTTVQPTEEKVAGLQEPENDATKILNLPRQETLEEDALLENFLHSLILNSDSPALLDLGSSEYSHRSPALSASDSSSEPQTPDLLISSQSTDTKKMIPPEMINDAENHVVVRQTQLSKTKVKSRKSQSKTNKRVLLGQQEGGNRSPLQILNNSENNSPRALQVKSISIGDRDGNGIKTPIRPNWATLYESLSGDKENQQN
ncbi:cell division cycle-associated protein 3 [Erpetoichthys calabaricus]|uniref:cell division cycle-associated protein 3 n=1 Tax=Erpetoichthys calabaricus TaxID=27687 RepID=UPI0022344B7C|nr:cell division cycle-associated protein 3 [Erpetoichthys calabaricus]